MSNLKAREDKSHRDYLKNKRENGIRKANFEGINKILEEEGRKAT
jgi:hypothetical protein